MLYSCTHMATVVVKRLTKVLHIHLVTWNGGCDTGGRLLSVLSARGSTQSSHLAATEVEQFAADTLGEWKSADKVSVDDALLEGRRCNWSSLATGNTSRLSASSIHCNQWRLSSSSFACRVWLRPESLIDDTRNVLWAADTLQLRAQQGW